jgi:hypothetical protein
MNYCVHVCDGCGRRLESSNFGLPASWVERRVVSPEKSDALQVYHVCSLTCWSKSLRKLADETQAKAETDAACIASVLPAVP